MFCVVHTCMHMDMTCWESREYKSGLARSSFCRSGFCYLFKTSCYLYKTLYLCLCARSSLFGYRHDTWSMNGSRGNDIQSSNFGARSFDGWIAGCNGGWVEYTNFRIAALELRRSGSRLFRSLVTAKSLSVLMFWMSHGDPWPTLQILAKQVFSMVASSAAHLSGIPQHLRLFIQSKGTVSARPPSKSRFTKQQNVAAAFSNNDDITHSDADY